MGITGPAGALLDAVKAEATIGSLTGPLGRILQASRGSDPPPLYSP